MTRALTSLLAVSLLLLYGCLMQNASNAKKLTDTVHEMNKAVRWGSLGMATGMVEPSYRERFIQTHRHWGQVVQVADTDVVHLEIAPDGESAVAMVAYQWYQADVMTLYQTVVRQRWSRAGDHFGLSGESVVQGDPRLLDPLLDPGAAPAPVAPVAPMMGDPASMSLASPDS